MKSKIKGVFSSTGEGFRKEWSYNKEELAKHTNKEFAEEVEKEFLNMCEESDFRAEIIYADYSKERFPKDNAFYVCLGHFIYTHILVFNPKNSYYRTDILNHEYFNNIVQPFMNKIKG